MERHDNPERAAIARLAAAYGNTAAGRDTIAAHVDLSRLHAICQRLSLNPPGDFAVRPAVADVEGTITNDATLRSVTCSVAIGEATLPPTRRSMWISAGDRHGPRLSGLDAADYLAVPAGGAGQLFTELRTQLTAAAASLYRAAEPLHHDRQEEQRIPGQNWEPTPGAIDALSELLEQDARWQAQILINDWYVRTVDRLQHIDRVTPAQPIQIDDTGVQNLPGTLCELLNEHWRAVYTRTINDQLHVIDALDTPGEAAMRDYLDAQELREAQEARDATSLDFPTQPGGDFPSPGSGNPGLDSGGRAAGNHPDQREDGEGLDR